MKKHPEARKQVRKKKKSLCEEIAVWMYICLCYTLVLQTKSKGWGNLQQTEWSVWLPSVGKTSLSIFFEKNKNKKVMEWARGRIYVTKGAALPWRGDKKVSEPTLKSPMFPTDAFNLHLLLTSNRDCQVPSAALWPLFCPAEYRRSNAEICHKLRE